MAVKKIISGGQTGADRAALDFAIHCGLPHGGWCPQGRTAEDGTIDWRYRLKETPSPAYVQRTEWNVRDADGTVIFTLRAELGGGSKLTEDFARQYRKPCLHLARDRDETYAVEKLRDFLTQNKIEILNVAGSRASTEPGLVEFTQAVLRVALRPE